MKKAKDKVKKYVNTKQFPFYILQFALFILLLSACGSETRSDATGDGSIAFGIEWQKNPASSNSKLLLSPSDCSDISTVEAKVYDANNINIANGGPWVCSAHSGTITGVPSGSNVRLVILAKNAAGDILYYGEQTAITVTAGQTTNVGPITASSFSPTGVTATAGNAQVTISWTSVTGATSYNIYWSTTTGVTKTTGTKILNATNPFTHTGLTNGTTYFYVVTAVDANGESAESAQVSATPTSTAPTTFTLTITKAGTGTGTVTSSPAGISCGATCAASYNSATSVTLTAAADAGSTFSGWSGGGCTGTGTCIVTMNAATSVTATFNPAPPGTFTLTVTKAGTGSGTVTSSDTLINCGVDCTEAYNSGTVMTLTATPAAGSTFSGWSGGGCTGTGTCVVTMSAATTVTATFNTAPPGTFTLTVTKAGTGSGTVTSSPAGINCGLDCTEPYNSGTAVTLTATSDASSLFAGWSGGGCTGTGTCAVTMTADTTVTVTFNLKQFTLTVTKAGTTGTGTVTSSPAGIDCGLDCTEPYNSGTAVTLTATPAVGSLFSGWSGVSDCSDGIVTMDAIKTCTATFTNQASVYFTDNFEAGLGNWMVSGQDWGLTTSTFRGGTNSITDSPSGNYLANANVSITLAGSINLTTSTSPVLTFWHKYFLGCCPDKAKVEISQDGGFTWLLLTEYTDSSSTWSFVQIDLTSYKSLPITIRFRLVDDVSGCCTPTVADGWYIDDVEIKEKSTASLSYPFTDNFEAGLGNWMVSGQDWGLTTSTFRGGTNSITDSPSGNYLANANVSITLAGSINLTTSTSPVLTFWHKYFLGCCPDKAKVEISQDGGFTWLLLTEYTDSSSTWSFVQIDLTSYKSLPITIRFRLVDDVSGCCTPTVADGWYIDDVEINEIGILTH